MNPTPLPPDAALIVYPNGDGKPIADNTKQLRWIVVLYGNLAALFRDVADVFVAGDLFWYPVEGRPDVCLAPDVLVVFGRPKGDRGAYQQWQEGQVPLTVVFEILSPGNTHPEMADKQAFYEDHGVEEYYVYDPDQNHLQVYLRKGDVLRRVRPVHNFVSPRLGIRFDLSGPEMTVYGPDGRPFLTFEQLTAEREEEQQRRVAAEQRADDEARRANEEARRAALTRQRAARLAELSRKARRQQATAEELAELEGLEDAPTPE
jgi:Uma2 family endonuclease